MPDRPAIQCERGAAPTAPAAQPSSALQACAAGRLIVWARVGRQRDGPAGGDPRISAPIKISSCYLIAGQAGTHLADIRADEGGGLCLALLGVGQRQALVRLVA
ncbi:MAG: hypothetical protein ACYDEY_05005 [Acidimicrobiales bacterium]